VWCQNSKRSNDGGRSTHIWRVSARISSSEVSRPGTGDSFLTDKQERRLKALTTEVRLQAKLTGFDNGNPAARAKWMLQCRRCEKGKGRSFKDPKVNLVREKRKRPACFDKM